MVVIGLIILAVLVDFTARQITTIQKERAIQTAQLAIDTLVTNANLTFSQGPGATREVQVVWPEGVEAQQSYLSNRSIVLRVYDTDVTGTANPLLSGSLPTNAGPQVVRVKAFDGFVAFGNQNVSSNYSQVFVTLLRDTNASFRITLSNASSTSASVSLSTDWNSSDVNLLVSPSSGTLVGNGTMVVDLNFSANAIAVGNYTATLTITSTLGGTTETLILPVQAQVLVGSGSQLVAFPTSISLNTFGADTNSTQLQLCNVGTTDLKSIRITPSSGTPGDWIQGMPSIPTLSAQSCQTVDVNANVTSSTLGTYYGSLTVSDFTGSNTVNIPLTIAIRGMDSVYYWSWSPATVSPNKISGFTMGNTGTKTIGITTITLRKWWTCDSELSPLTQLTINGNVAYAGSFSDGNTLDIVDFNIPVLTSYSNNALTFNGIIDDQNEQFQPVVTFTDGTTYYGPTLGVGCALDTTPPATVSDLQMFQGSEPRTVRIQFTMPGDDGNSGRVHTLNIRRSRVPIASESDFNNAFVVPYTGTLPYPMGGTTYSQIIDDLNVGEFVYMAVEGVDENGNSGALSNAAINKPWNEFSWSGNDFNFPNFVNARNVFPFQLPATDRYDVNVFTIHNFTLPAATSRKLVMSVFKSTQTWNGWAIALDMNQTDVNHVRIWDDEEVNADFLSVTPDYEANVSWSLSQPINLISNTLLPTPYHFNGDEVQLVKPNTTFRVNVLTNITDFNLRVDMNNLTINGSSYGGGSGVGQA